MQNYETASNQAFKDQQERRNSTIWDAITLKDYEKYKREQDARVLKRKEEQEKMRNFLDGQVKETEFKKSIEQKTAMSEYDQLLQKIKKEDQQAIERYKSKRQQLEDQVKENFNLIQRKKNLNSFEKTQSKNEEKHFQKSFIQKANALDHKHMYGINKIKEDIQRQLKEDLSHQQLLKTSNKALSKMDHLKHMNQEFDLLLKNQDRHKNKIKELVERNDKIYNATQKSPYKNLSVAEKDREQKLKLHANQSFAEEVKKRNYIMDEVQKKKHQDYMSLQTIHLQQIEDKLHRKRQSNTIELLNDKVMLQSMQNHEKEMLIKEKMEEEKRKQLCKQMLEEHKNSSTSGDPLTSTYFTREFELNKSLIKEISPNRSSII